MDQGWRRVRWVTSRMIVRRRHVEGCRREIGLTLPHVRGEAEPRIRLRVVTDDRPIGTRAGITPGRGGNGRDDRRWGERGRRREVAGGRAGDRPAQGVRRGRGRGRRARRGERRVRARQDDRDHGSVGVRQVDADAPHGGAGPADAAARCSSTTSRSRRSRTSSSRSSGATSWASSSSRSTWCRRSTAKENITLPIDIAGRDVDQEWFETIIKTVGLRDRLKHRPNQLSGGQQQRVACARALVSRPTIVFADEPTGNLDSRASEEILGFLRRSVDEFGQTIVMVTHEPVVGRLRGPGPVPRRRQDRRRDAQPDVRGRARAHEGLRGRGAAELTCCESRSRGCGGTSSASC